MRTFCTVSAPLEVCAPPTRPLSPGSRFLALRLLGTPQPRTLYFLVEAKSRVREVYSQTCLHFAKQGMLDTELFGLAVLIDGEYMFADPESKLSKYGPKSWRSSHTHGLDANGRPLLELHFRVQFYIESPFILRDETSRHNYYLQLKANAISRDVPKEYSEQSMILLGGLALQADFGDCLDDECCPSESPAILSSSSSSSVSVAVQNQMTTTTSGSTAASSNIGGGNGNNGGSISCISNSKTNNINSNSNNNSNSNSSIINDINQLKITTNSLRNISKIGNIGEIDSIVVPASSTSSLATNSSTSATTASSIPPSSSSIDYFRLEEYLPTSIHSAWSASALRSCHRENRGISRSDAELNYIRQACTLHEAINAHVYRMKMSKTENGQGSVWLVVYAKGIRIYSENAQPIIFLWPNITKLSFERKKFEIRSGENKITLYSISDEKNKMLLTLCRETHQFSMKIAARLKEAIRREEEENQCIDACYIYSRSLHLPYKNKNDQRISVISSTSSNTTSGIVSDRVHSEDELEIMINTPPAAISIAAPSTESLALAHLLDRPSVSRQTSSAGQVSLKDLEEHLVSLSERSTTRSISSDSTSGAMASTSGNSAEQNSSTVTNIKMVERSRGGTNIGDSSGSISNETDSPNSHHNIGSQCSSTCSTVVVATDTITLSSLAAHTASSNRRTSTSSSLELGFSHTAQNSTLSEGASTCVDHEFRTQQESENDETQSGVYTLEHGAPPTETSGVYTMNSSEMTGQSSEIAESESHDSSHYGCFQPNSNMINGDVDEGVSETTDSVDGHRTLNYDRNRMKTDDMSEFRLRSDSNISGSGSFRGDGSDPTDNKHTLLTAEELTDLIVGRGTYPSRKTVSNTLDSDSDYVTLPLSLGGDSYGKGREGTAPREDVEVDMMDVILPTDPPAPPKRIDSNIHHSLSSLVDISNRMRSPPPYNARHETTGLCGPQVCNAIQTAPSNCQIVKSSVQQLKSQTKAPPGPTSLRDPPPYPQQPIKSQIKTKQLPAQTSQTGLNANVPEEVTARFITTRPQINILKAHTSVVTDNAKPSYAAPTMPAIITSSTTTNKKQTISKSSQKIRSHHNLVGNSIASKSLGQINHQQQLPTIPSTIGIPIVPYNIHSPHKSMSSIPPPPLQYHHEVKSSTPRACVLLPVIQPRQYLPPPPPTLPRQPPPPPPPPQLATVYTSQLARSQIELYQQQLYSDVDYVIYPLQDPAISQQEYLDAKQGSILAAMAAQSPPPPPYLAYHTGAANPNSWDACKGHAIYRSTPYLPIALSSHSRYASTQNLSDTYVQLPGAYSPLYSPSVASLCSSYEPPPPPPLRPSTLAAAHHQSLFARSRSDDNILNSIDAIPKIKRLPPPPPPPYVNRRVKKPPMPVPIEKPPPIPVKPLSHQSLTPQHHTQMNHSKILFSGCSTLPHHSSSQIHRKLPQNTIPIAQHKLSSSTNNVNLISSASPTNISSLLKSSSTTIPAIASTIQSSCSTNTNQTTSNNNGTASSIDIQTLREKSKNMDLPLIAALCNDRSLLKQTKAFVMPRHPKNSLTSSLSPPSNKSLPSTKYPVSGLSTTQLAKPRKTSISHRHPNDKLPPLPMQTAEANNYVMDPTPSAMKNKSYNSQTALQN